MSKTYLVTAREPCGRCCGKGKIVSDAGYGDKMTTCYQCAGKGYTEAQVSLEDALKQTPVFHNLQAFIKGFFGHF